MLIALACLICALVFIAALPVRLGALKLPERALRLGVTVGFVRIQTDVYFEFQNAVPTIEMRFRRHSRTLPLTRETLRPAHPPPLKNALRFLRGRVRLDRLNVDAAVSLGDAALTAPACALLTACAEAARHILPDAPIRCRFSCAFSGRGSLRALGIVSLRGGHLMIAALILGRDVIARRLHQWTNTPSKPS